MWRMLMLWIEIGVLEMQHHVSNTSSSTWYGFNQLNIFLWSPVLLLKDARRLSYFFFSQNCMNFNRSSTKIVQTILYIPELFGRHQHLEELELQNVYEMIAKSYELFRIVNIYWLIWNISCWYDAVNVNNLCNKYNDEKNYKKQQLCGYFTVKIVNI